MSRPTKSERAMAAELCSLCASYGSPISITRMMEMLYGLSVDETVTVRFAKLAVRAWDAANRKATRPHHDADSLRDDYAEAESMLREGWQP